METQDLFLKYPAHNNEKGLDGPVPNVSLRANLRNGKK